MNDTPLQIQFALISHTNNGKTTLARTLTGMDVGEVRDAAHVTSHSESHVLLRSPTGDTLQLWDTPGFGDSLRLMKRLAMSGNPIGWLLREIVDRYRDRPLWLSQQALRTARDSADVVLYLVNASEHPQDAGYLPAEMKILEWLGKPVAVLLNQMGPPRPGREEEEERAHWREHLQQYPAVREVLALDAFARCWVHEHVFYEALGKLIPDAKATAYQRLVTVWQENNAQRFRDAMRLISSQLCLAAADLQAITPEEKSVLHSALRMVGLGKSKDRPQQEKAMNVLVTRLEENIDRSTRALLELYRIDPSEATRINARVRENFVTKVPLDKAQAGLIGAIMSGAASGVSADLVSGGLTMGSGALIGGIVGALTFAGAAWGFNLTTDRDQASVRFSDEFMHTLVSMCILRYLAIIHFGRGRGNFVESEAPSFWQDEVRPIVDAQGQALKAAWQNLRADANHEQARAQLQHQLEAMVAGALERLYPGMGSGPLSG